MSLPHDPNADWVFEGDLNSRDHDERYGGTSADIRRRERTEEQPPPGANPADRVYTCAEVAHECRISDEQLIILVIKGKVDSSYRDIYLDPCDPKHYVFDWCERERARIYVNEHRHELL